MKKINDDGKISVFGLYIDCAGRAAVLSNIETEEAAEVQQVMNRYNTPLLGLYSGVEVAPILGKSRGLMDRCLNGFSYGQLKWMKKTI